MLTKDYINLKINENEQGYTIKLEPNFDLDSNSYLQRRYDEVVRLVGVHLESNKYKPLRCANTFTTCRKLKKAHVLERTIRRIAYKEFNLSIMH
jgi:hypothetical protein